MWVFTSKSGEQCHKRNSFDVRLTLFKGPKIMGQTKESEITFYIVFINYNLKSGMHRHDQRLGFTTGDALPGLYCSCLLLVCSWCISSSVLSSASEIHGQSHSCQVACPLSIKTLFGCFCSVLQVTCTEKHLPLSSEESGWIWADKIAWNRSDSILLLLSAVMLFGKLIWSSCFWGSPVVSILRWTLYSLWRSLLCLLTLTHTPDSWRGFLIWPTVVKGFFFTRERICPKATVVFHSLLGLLALLSSLVPFFFLRLFETYIFATLNGFALSPMGLVWFPCLMTACFTSRNSSLDLILTDDSNRFQKQKSHLESTPGLLPA